MSSKPRTRLSPGARTDQLLDAAKQMIVEDGLQSFTMEALARAAAVSSPLVYNYFPNRVALLQTLLEREQRRFAAKLADEVAAAEDFDEIVRIFVASNFDHHAPGNILPVLQSQPEIASGVKKLRKQQSRQTAEFLVRKAARTYQLTLEQAQLVITMSSGASIAAAEWAAMSKLSRQLTIDSALAYIRAGIEAIANVQAESVQAGSAKK